MNAQTFRIPGTTVDWLVEHSSDGTSRRLSAAGRQYLMIEKGTRTYEGGWVTVSEAALPNGLLRRGRVGRETWLERYRFDSQSRPVEVDGVPIERDSRGRVVQCGADWRYTYQGDRLHSIAGPFGTRQLLYEPGGRVKGLSQNGQIVQFGHASDAGCTRVPSPPQHWHRDALGRLWTITDDQGTVLVTFLWDGFACFGRIDGPPGGSLAAVFSLDTTLTPVRVVTRSGVQRVQRDLFGEGLLALDKVPGLFGAAVHDGYAYTGSRVLNPAVGSFNAPDPWDGSESDPRRAAGYMGPLLAGRTTAGPYALCGYDAVTFTDPTGNMPIPGLWAPIYTLSSLTWSSQYMIANFAFLQMFVNLIFGTIAGRFLDVWDISFMGSGRRGNYGLRITPAGIEAISNFFIGLFSPGAPQDRRFTIHSVFWSPSEGEWNELQRAHVFAPSADFRPRLYGTLLRVQRPESDPFLLRGSNAVNDDPFGSINEVPDRAPGWTRAGGRAQPAVPGSQVPVFGTGGLNFDQPVDEILIEDPGDEADSTISELVPEGGLYRGVHDQWPFLELTRTGTGLADGNTLLLTDGSNNVVITTIFSLVERGGNTLLRLTADPNDPRTNLDANGISLRNLNVPPDNDTLNAGTANDRLSVAGAGLVYEVDQALRIQDSTNAFVADATIRQLEAQLQLDAALPAGLGSNLSLWALQPPVGSSLQPIERQPQADRVRFPGTDPTPAVDDILQLAHGSSNTMAVRLTGNPDAEDNRIFQLDRPINASLVGPLQFQRLNKATVDATGTRSGPPETASVFTYSPVRVPSALSSGHIIVEARAGGLAVRDVTNLNREELVLTTGGTLAGAAAPLNVTRYLRGAITASGLDLRLATTLIIDPLNSPSESVPGVALSVFQLAGDTPTAAHRVDLVDDAPRSGNTITVDNLAQFNKPLTGGAPASRDVTHAPTPGLPLLVREHGTTDWQTALVQHVRTTVTVTQPLPFPGRTDLRAALFDVAGARYTAQRQANRRLTARPFLLSDNPATDRPLPMPRFAAGDIVEVDWQDGGNPFRQMYRVITVNGTTLDLDTDAPLDIPASATDIEVQRYDVVNPGTGGPFVGIDGEASGNDLTLNVWKPNALLDGQRLAVTNGEQTTPTEVSGFTRMEIEFYDLGGLSGNRADMAGLDVQATVHAPSFEQTDDTVTLPGGGLNPGSDLVLIVPFVVPDDGPIQATGKLHNGSVLIPQEPSEEVDRLQCLKEHELVHSEQFARLGPLMLSYYPWFLVDLLFDVIPGSDAGEPTTRFYSDPIDGEITNREREPGPAGGGILEITVGDTGGVDVQADMPVRIYYQEQAFDLVVAERRSDTVFTVRLGMAAFITLADLFSEATTTPTPTQVQVLFLQDQSTAARVLRHIHSFFEIFTVGGLSNLLMGSTIAGLGYFFEHLFYYWPARLFGDGEFPREDYFTATQPEATAPRLLRMQPRDGGDTLELSRGDFVKVRRGDGFEERAHVIFVEEDGDFEVEVNLPDNGEPIQVARIDRADRFGFYDDALLTRLGYGWIRYITDPWGQLDYRAGTGGTDAGSIITRVMRYLAGSSSWLLIPGAMGYFWFDNAVNNDGINGWRSHMEQEASEESGDLYSPLGRMDSTARLFVGDLRRYYYWTLDRFDHLLEASRGDAPGVHYEDLLRLVPTPTGALAGGASEEPNLTLDTANINDGGYFAPEVLYGSSPADPRRVPVEFTGPGSAVFGPSGFRPNHRGHIPMSPTQQRTIGTYVTFSRPGQHRVTISNDTIRAGWNDRGRLAQGAQVQRLFYDFDGANFDHGPNNPPEVQDVTVTVGGYEVGNDETLDLVRLQHAAVVVTPNGSRHYAITLAQPGGSTLLTTTDSFLDAQSNAVNAEPVEVSRVHTFDGNAFDNGVLNEHGMHLPATFHVSVRQFRVNVVDTVPLRAPLPDAATLRADPTANQTAELRAGGEGFAVIPVEVRSVRSNINPPAGRPVFTLPTLTAVELPEDRGLMVFLGDGSLVRASLDVNDPPDDAMDAEIEIEVRRNGTAAQLRVALTLQPHFLLTPTSGVFTVARPATVTLDSAEPISAVEVVPPAGADAPRVQAEVTGANQVTVQIAANADPGSWRFIVQATANADQRARCTLDITT